MIKKILFLLLFLACVASAASYIGNYCTTVYHMGELDWVDWEHMDECSLEWNETEPLYWERAPLLYIDSTTDFSDTDTTNTNLAQRLEYGVDKDDQSYVTLGVSIERDSGAGVEYTLTTEKYYWLGVEWENLTNNFTAHTVAYNSYAGTQAAYVDICTEYECSDHISLSEYGDTPNTDIGNITMMNATHLNISMSGVQMNLSYSDGTENSSYLYVNLFTKSENTDNDEIAYIDFGMPINCTGEYISIGETGEDRSDSSEIEKYAETDVTVSMYAQYMITHNDEIKKVLSPRNENHSVMVDGLDGMNGVTLICKVYIYNDDGLLLPKLIYHTDENFVMNEWYNIAGYSYVLNGSTAFVLDEHNRWWLLPAVTCNPVGGFTSGLTDDTPQLAGTIYVSTASEGLDDTDSITTPVPTIPLSDYCTYDETNYTIYYKTASTQTHLVQKIYCNGTWNTTDYTCNDTLSTINIEYETNELNVTYNITEVNATYGEIVQINYYVDGVLTCTWTEGYSSMLGFGLGGTDFGESIPSHIISIIFAFGCALSVFIPFFIFFPMVFNEMFSIVTVLEMSFIIVAVAFVGAFLRYDGPQSLKTVGFYVLIAVALLAQFYVFTGLAEHAGISAMEDSISDAAGAFAEADIASFTLATFNGLVLLAQFCLLIPYYITEIILGWLQLLAPDVANVFNSFKNIISLGMYIYLGAKIYQILRSDNPII